MGAPGTLFTVGVGPGDPELMTVKAARILAAAPVAAYFAKRGRPGHARSIAAGALNPAAQELRFEYPFTTELSHADLDYKAGMASFYASCADAVASRLADGEDVALLCEGDPFFYGSAMYLFDRLRGGFPTEVVPGITGMAGCWARAQVPATGGDDVLSVLPGTLDQAGLTAALLGCDAAVVMKLGRNLPKVRAALEHAGMLGRALYIERGTMADERVAMLADVPDGPAPYFSLVLVPGRQRGR